MNDLEWKLSQLEECMVRMAEEIADSKRRITDVEGVLMEQFDDRSEVGSLVSSIDRSETGLLHPWLGKGLFRFGYRHSPTAWSYATKLHRNTHT